MALDGWELGENPSVSPDEPVVATTPETTDRRALHRERWARWVFTAVLSLFLLLSLAGFFGVRTAHTTTSGGGYDVEVTYSAVTRPGLATPFDIEITRAGGFTSGEPVRVAVSSRYLAMFDENGVSPDAAAATSTADAVIWEFDPPETGDVLTISFDHRIEPGVQWGRDGFVRVLDGEAPVAEAEFHTWVTP